MLKKLILAALIAAPFGGFVSAFSTPAAAAIDSYMYFLDYDGHYEP